MLHYGTSAEDILSRRLDLGSRSRGIRDAIRDFVREKVYIQKATEAELYEVAKQFLSSDDGKGLGTASDETFRLSCAELEDVVKEVMQYKQREAIVTLHK